MDRLLPLRLLLAVAYPLLAHAASVRHDAMLASLALLDLVVVMALVPLARGRPWAWALLFASALFLWSVRAGPLPELLLLFPPMLFTGVLGWWFARSLREGSTPVVTRIVAALEACRPPDLPPDVARYAYRLTAAWAGLLLAMTAASLALALLAEPDGLLLRMGYAPPVQVSRATWSTVANLLDHGLIGAFFVAEFLWRQFRFPERRQGPLAYAKAMARLGPAFWRGLFREAR